MATEPFFQIQKSFCHGFTSVTKSLWAPVCWKVRTCCMPSQPAPSPKVLQLAHWLPEETVAGCCILNVFFPPKPVFIGGLHPQARNHRATPQGACFHGSHCRPEQSSNHLPSGMLMRCTCTVPWTTSSTSKTFCDQTKRSTSKELAIRVSHHAPWYHEERPKGLALYRHSPIAPFPKQHLRHSPYLGVSGAGREAARRTC